MNIGDKVRMLHSTEQGIITKFLSGDRIEVEIEDGFQIPVRRNEIAVVSVEENTRFGKNQTPEEAQNNSKNSKTTTISQKGIYVAFIALNQEKYAIHLINNTDLDLPFVIGEETENFVQGIATNVLKGRQSLKFKEVNLSDFEKWGVFVFQFLYFSYNKISMRMPFVKKLRCRSNSFFKAKGQVPILLKEGYVFQLDKEETEENLVIPEKTPEIDVQKLKEEMFTPKVNTILPLSQIVKRPAKEIDLHIEKLTSNYNNMNNGEMLALQLDTFERNLENAIVAAMDEIVFIHGVGNGVLKQEIHRKLSQNKDIKFFQDAKKEKFGYGATLVALK
ncbi:MAG: DNA mismatch repair protein MutS [Bacteroidetes bacterium]|nr:MAG: DNA mismatch repair protein MutS [Bacteroidota bacterium]TAG95860.1 MAG: DNA mismatch repair protein MutS [Bacteroidota bacterium]